MRRHAAIHRPREASHFEPGQKRWDKVEVDGHADEVLAALS